MDRFAGGTRLDGTLWTFAVQPVREVSRELVTAVTAYARSGGHLVLVRNPRGWDVPGGRLEPGEGLREALARELREEACARLVNAEPFALLESDRDAARITYILVFRAEVELDNFDPCHETTARRVVDDRTFVEIFSGGNVEMAAKLLEMEKERSVLRVSR